MNSVFCMTATKSDIRCIQTAYRCDETRGGVKKCLPNEKHVSNLYFYISGINWKLVIKQELKP